MLFYRVSPFTLLLYKQLPSKVKIIKIYLNIYFICFQLFSEGKLYSSTSLIFNFCISYRNHPASWRNIRAHPVARRGFFFWSSGQRCRTNRSPELWFGRARFYWPYIYLYRQAPVHNPIILCNLLQFSCAFKLLELNENLRCIILGAYWLTTRFESELAALLIGPVKVGWLSVTRELIGVDCLLSAISIRTMDRFGYKL